MTQGVSIIVCCYNSEARIGETLRHLFALQVPSGWKSEILLINNNSRDNTYRVAMEAHQQYKNEELPFYIINEGTQGLISARLRGIQESKNEIVIFCDDDNHLAPDYLLRAQEIFDRDPSIGVLGGWCRPKLPFDPGKWIVDFFGALAIEQHPREESSMRWVFGAGMALRKKMLTELKERNIKFLLSGRTGKQQTSGDDAEICLLARIVGYEIYYSPTLKLDHAISANRITKKNFIRTSGENFYPIMYLFLLDKVVYEQKRSSSRLYLMLLTERLYRVFYFMPRCLFGSHRFYSFISFYGNLFFAGWLSVHFLNFRKTYKMIQLNLSGNDGI